MKIELRKPNDLKPYSNNPRRIPNKAVKAVAESISQFGFTQPIVVDAKGVVVVGHTRLQAAKLLGLDKVPVHVAKSLTPEQITAYRIIDNQVGTLTGWQDDDLIGEVQKVLNKTPLDLSVFGFKPKQLDVTRLPGGAKYETLNQPKKLPNTDIKPGDILQFPSKHKGTHKLICGDALDSEVRKALIGRLKPHLCVTDPPYGVDYEPDWRNATKPTGAVSIVNKVEGDKITPDSFLPALTDVKSVDVFYSWFGIQNLRVIFNFFEAAGIEYKIAIVWLKDHFVLSRGHFNQSAYEFCFHGLRRGGQSHWVGGKGESPIVKGNVNKGTFGAESHPLDYRFNHPTQKPVECMSKGILCSSKRGDLVYDPYAGSGSTLVAAEETGRRALCIELDPQYCELIRQRWLYLYPDRKVKVIRA